MSAVGEAPQPIPTSPASPRPRARDVDPAHHRELKQQDHHIRRLVLTARARVRVVERGQRAISRHPTEVIHQLARLDGDGYRKYVEEEGGQYDFLWVATGCFGEGVGLSVREDAYRKLMSELWREAATTRTTTNSNQARSSIRPFVRLVIVWTKLVSIWANRISQFLSCVRTLI